MKTSDVRLWCIQVARSTCGYIGKEQKAAGWYTVKFLMHQISQSGFYMYRITANGSQGNQKMTLIK